MEYILSEEVAKKQIEDFFGYYEEDLQSIMKFQSEFAKASVELVIDKLTRQIRSGTISLESETDGFVIKQKLYHHRSIKEVVYRPINGNTVLMIQSLNGVEKMTKMLGIMSGIGEDQMKTFSGKDWQTANTIYAFLSLF